MIKFGVGDAIVIPVLLPGVILCCGLVTLFGIVEPDRIISFAKAIDSWSRGQATSAPGAVLSVVLGIAVLSLYALSVLSGAILSVAAGYVEYYVLDRLCAKRLKLSWDDYWEQWQRYVEHLEHEDSKNTYISGYVDLFLFQLRLSVACLLLALVAFALDWWKSWSVALNWVFGISVLVLLIIGFSSTCYHEGLARYRNRRFKSAPHEVRDTFELVARLLSKWCRREAYQPLAFVLPHWPAQSDKVGLQALSGALGRANELNTQSVYGAERDILLSAKKLIDAQVANLQ